MTHRTLSQALSLAVALTVAALGPFSSAGTALAATSNDASEGAREPSKGAASTPSKSKPARAGKGKGKKSAAPKARASGKAASKAKKAGQGSKPAKAKRAAGRQNKPATRRAKTPPKVVDSDSPQPRAAKPRARPAPCAGAVVSLDRGGAEAERLSLVDCHGKPLDAAVAKVSVLARPWGTPKRSASSVRRLDAGVLTRLDAVAKKLPGRTLTLIGGPPAGAGASSAHDAGRAVDLRVDGVDDRKLVEVCRSLPDTGCGYYPNASFVHIDARPAGSGKVYWIDASEPGEPPRYVASWPPPAATPAAAPRAPAKP